MKYKEYSKEWIEQLCAESNSLSEVVRKTGRSGGGSIELIKRKINEWNIDISHFTGHAWNKGLTKANDTRIVSRQGYSFSEVFCANSPVTQKMLRGYVKRFNAITYICSECGCDGNWNGGIIKLELDHIDGDNKNNSINNLRYLCPNCHALTDTYRGKNIKRRNKQNDILK